MAMSSDLPSWNSAIQSVVESRETVFAHHQEALGRKLLEMDPDITKRRQKVAARVANIAPEPFSMRGELSPQGLSTDTSALGELDQVENRKSVDGRAAPVNQDKRADAGRIKHHVADPEVAMHDPRSRDE